MATKIRITLQIKVMKKRSMCALPVREETLCSFMKAQRWKVSRKGIQKVALEPEDRTKVSPHALSPLTDRILKEIA